MKKRILLLNAVLAGLAMFLGACAGYVSASSDYYGPAYGGPVFYGHPYYRNDTHIVPPPRHDWHGNGRPSAPVHENHSAPSHENHSAPAQADHNRK